MNTETINQLKQQWKAALESGITTLSAKAPEKARAIKAMVDEYGGVGHFMEEMKKRGIPEKAKTWVEDGKKFVLSQEQVQKLLGDERVKKIAEKLKMTPEVLATQLGEALPPLLEKVEGIRAKIDAASQNLPANSFVGGLLKKVGGLFGGTSSSASNTDAGSSTSSSAGPTQSTSDVLKGTDSSSTKH